MTLKDDREAAMTLTLDAKLEAALGEKARQRGLEPEALALDVLRHHFLRVEPIDDWERELFAAAIDCGVSLSDAALSREEMYDL